MASWWGRFARPVACRPHCRRRGRLNPFKGVVMGGRKGRALGRGTDFYDSKKDEHGTRRVPCFFSRSRVLSISFFLFSSSLSCTPLPYFLAFRARDRWSTRTFIEICTDRHGSRWHTLVTCMRFFRGWMVDWLSKIFSTISIFNVIDRVFLNFSSIFLFLDKMYQYLNWILIPLSFLCHL